MSGLLLTVATNDDGEKDEVEIKSPTSTIYDRRAVQLALEGNDEAAANLFRKALSTQPRSLDAVFHESIHSWVRCESTDHDVLQRLQSFPKNRFATSYYYALIHARRGDYQAALQYISEARKIQLDPTSDSDHDGFDLMVPATQRLSVLDTLQRLVDAAHSAMNAQLGLYGAQVLHEDWVKCLVFSLDGTTVVSGSGDQTVRVWDVKNGQNAQVWEADRFSVSSVCITVDKSTVYSSGMMEPIIRKWDLQSGECVIRFEGHQRPINSIAVSADASVLLSGSLDFSCKVWNTSTGTCLRTLKGHFEMVNCVSLSVDGAMAVSGGQDKLIRLWNLNNGRSAHVFQGHSSFVTTVALTGDNSFTVSGSEDSTVRIWHNGRGELFHTLKRHLSEIHSVSISFDGSRIMSASAESIRLWDLQDGRCVKTLRPRSQGCTSAVMDVTGSLIFAGYSDGHVLCWPTNRGCSVDDFTYRAALATTTKDIPTAVDQTVERRRIDNTDECTNLVLKSVSEQSMTVAQRLALSSMPGQLSDPLPVVVESAMEATPINMSQLEPDSAQKRFDIDSTPTSMMAVAEPDFSEKSQIVYEPPSELMTVELTDEPTAVESITAESLHEAPRQATVKDVSYANGPKAAEKQFSTADIEMISSSSSINSENQHSSHMLIPKAVQLIDVTQEPAVTCLSFSLDGETVITGHVNGQMTLWSLVTEDRIGSTQVYLQSVTAVSYRRSNGVCVTGNEEDEVVVIALERISIQKRIQSQVGGGFRAGGVVSIQLSATEQTAVIASSMGSVRIMDVATGVFLSQLQFPTTGLRHIIVSDSMLYGLTEDHRCLVDTLQPVTVSDPHIQRVVLGVNCLAVLDVSIPLAEKLFPALLFPPPATSHVFTVSDLPVTHRTVTVCGTKGGTLKICNGYVDMCFAEIKGHRVGILDIRVSADSDFFVSVSADRCVKVWNRYDLSCVSSFVEPEESFDFCVALPPPLLHIYTHISTNPLQPLSAVKTSLSICVGTRIWQCTQDYTTQLSLPIDESTIELTLDPTQTPSKQADSQANRVIGLRRATNSAKAEEQPSCNCNCTVM
eukprot:GILJ01012739.1.p1 GENE.GILJ01012739.1~~GILJ01012739.1.p1  ORF type:complete len:1070 (+),score=198.97 GILJ01012739.1:88-3297(+)